jgi:predicted acylesterase/phospholipase RssA
MESFDALVFAGGGPQTTAYIGCVRYLEHIGALPGAVRTFVGTSAGAVLAFLCALGLSADQALAWALQHVRSGDLTTLDVDGLLLLPERLGIDDGARLVGALRAALRAALGCEDATFAELAKTTGRNLVVCACNVTLERHEFFGVDTTPDVSVLTALRMSCCLPILFTPVEHDGCLYVDGGLLANLPVDFARRDGGSAIGARTLALCIRCSTPTRLAGRPAGESESRAPMSLGGYLLQIMQTVMRRANDSTRARQSPSVRVVELQLERAGDLQGLDFDVASMAFSVTPEALEQQVAAGYAAIKRAMPFRPPDDDAAAEGRPRSSSSDCCNDVTA